MRLGALFVLVATMALPLTAAPAAGQYYYPGPRYGPPDYGPPRYDGPRYPSPVHDRATLEAIQEELAARGYRPGPVPGRLDAATRRAIRRYQGDAGLIVDGWPSQALLDHLSFARGAPPGGAPVPPGPYVRHPPPDRVEPVAPPPEAYRQPYRPPEPRAQARPAAAPSLVARIQAALARRGHDPGPVDGIPGPRTGAAIADYQRASGLPVNGWPSRALLDHLEAAPTGGATPPAAPPAPPVARAPAQAAAPAAAGPTAARAPGFDPAVAHVQVELARRGYDVGPPDGLLGPETRAAIAAFQRDTGLTPDGAIDAALLERLR